MYKVVRSKKVILTVIFIVCIVIIFSISISNKNKIIFLGSDIEKRETMNPEQKICLDKANIVFKKMNNLNPRLDYSFAKNNSTLENVLGSKYEYIFYKNNNCYAIVQNYNPQINEYRYSVMNLDTQVLETVLLDHDLKSDSQYRKEFIEKYRSLFIK